MRRYGVRYETIRYWQDIGREFRKMEGRPYIGGIGRNIEAYSARLIGHEIIALAASTTPETVSQILRNCR